MNKNHLSVHNEPALTGGVHHVDPAEQRAENRIEAREEIDELRDSVRNEPWATSATEGPTYGQWLVRKRHETSLGFKVWCTLVAAITGGLFAILGAFMAGQQGLIQVIYIVVFGPVIEELLKQSGMIYLLERRPERVFAAWQFVFVGAVSALIFATIENLLYINVYAASTEMANPEGFAQFRWSVCTTLHMCCSVIASLGLIRVWRRIDERGQPADLSYAFPLFAIAIVVHGAYNLFALFWTDIF